jgi:hypothetical protein
VLIIIQLHVTQDGRLQTLGPTTPPAETDGAKMPGYGELAKFMSSRADTAIFRRFANLNTEVLLHMQAELSGIEMSLNVLRTTPNWNAFDSSWLTPPPCNTNAAVGDLFERARVLLDRYCKLDGTVAWKDD